MAGMDLFLPGAVCLGDMLNDTGYNRPFMGGAFLDFAGKGKFYSSHDFSEIPGKNDMLPQLADPAYSNFWGLYDDSLLEYHRGNKTTLLNAYLGLAVPESQIEPQGG